MLNTGVLIVEHDERLNRVLSRIIKRMGLESYSAFDYRDFKDIYVKNSPEIIFLSVGIPGSDYAGVCRFLAEQHSHSVIVLLSDLEDEELHTIRELVSSAGLNMGGILNKPLDMDRVKEVIASLNHSDQMSGLKKNSEIKWLSQIYNQVKILIQISDLFHAEGLIFDLNHLIPKRKIVFNALHNEFLHQTP